LSDDRNYSEERGGETSHEEEEGSAKGSGGGPGDAAVSSVTEGHVSNAIASAFVATAVESRGGPHVL